MTGTPVHAGSPSSMPGAAAPGRPETPRGQGLPRRRPRRSSASGLPRRLPWDSAMTRLWPGTKMLCLTALSTALLLWPRWAAVTTVGAALLIGSLVARVPASALPRLPVWFWSGVAGGCIGAALGGGLWIFVRSLLVAGLIVWGSSLLVWTTPLGRLAPALRTLMAPLRWLRIPADEWATSMVLALRGLPTMVEQTSAVTDAVKLRSGGHPPTTWTEALHTVIDIVTASLSAASRRASDTGRAMTLRGGVPPVPGEPVRLGWRDAAAVAVTAAAVWAAVAFAHGWPEWMAGWLPG